MKDSRRDFLKKAAATAAPLAAFSGCTGTGSREELEAFYIETDLEELDTEVDGHDLYVNVMTYAEDRTLEDMTLEYREPGEDVWNVLDREEAKGGEVQISEPFHAETVGEYEFRSVASTGETNYVSETEEVRFK